jgi:hypothetical protein
MRALAAMTLALITTLLAHALDEKKPDDPNFGISAQTHQRSLWQRSADGHIRHSPQPLHPKISWC